MPTFHVTLSDGATVTAHGRDDVDALATVLQSTGSLGDVIQLCAETAPEIVERGRQGPGDSAVRAVVAWWRGLHPEITITEANPWDLAKGDPTRWHVVSRAKADELLNLLPPHYFPGGFAVSEPIRHEGGVGVYLCVVNVLDKWWVRESTIAAAREAMRLRAVSPDGPVAAVFSVRA